MKRNVGVGQVRAPLSQAVGVHLRSSEAFLALEELHTLTKNLRLNTCVGLSPLGECSPVLGTNHLEFDSFCPQNGTALLNVFDPNDRPHGLP